ncbi:NifB/NifX family molybdenum-iron cluster-binding protein [Mangrovibacterium marinum]|uniref:Putative Fe-Mo cluster-binding NifX family protein n=1 Tax=Mangrovibacterium marinum TaxID=1639118 RepID=A0A2T5C037_9BACT|nr:NifB/NifX family molybdenum-iron cluster-binding protein [Mangrovibacterium marinum]PTN07930.1 putative Fe-Mo cluster-binding NifX family protein [Mangrovibacterium marinum]
MIAISATDKKLTSSMDLRFGRAPYFLLTDGETSRFVSNPFCNEESNIGPRLVNFLKEHNVNRIVTGEIGPKAKAKLDEFKIQLIMLSEDKIALLHILKKMNLNR